MSSIFRIYKLYYILKYKNLTFNILYLNITLNYFHFKNSFILNPHLSH